MRLSLIVIDANSTGYYLEYWFYKKLATKSLVQ